LSFGVWPHGFGTRRKAEQDCEQKRKDHPQFEHAGDSFMGIVNPQPIHPACVNRSKKLLDNGLCGSYPKADTGLTGGFRPARHDTVQKSASGKFHHIGNEKRSSRKLTSRDGPLPRSRLQRRNPVRELAGTSPTLPLSTPIILLFL
jgi:hypothetical protein